MVHIIDQRGQRAAQAHSCGTPGSTIGRARPASLRSGETPGSRSHHGGPDFSGSG
jgi:hypothetical protein